MSRVANRFSPTYGSGTSLRTVAPGRESDVAICAVLFCISLVYALTFFNYTVDDAAIYWKVSRNILGGMYSYNTEGTRFDPCSGTLYVVLGLIPELLRVDSRIFFKLVGLTVLAVFAIRCVGYAGIRNRKKWRYWPTLLLLVTPYSYVHALSGLETILFSYLMFESFVAVHESSRDQKVWARLPLVVLLLALTRWEGILIGGLCLAYVFLSHPADRRRELLQRGALIFLAPLAALIMWRWEYFGDPLPTSFYFKSAALPAGLRLHHLFWFHWERLDWLVPCALLSALVAAGKDRCVAAMLGIVLIVMAVYSQMALEMNFAERFAFGLLLPLLLFVCGSLDWMDSRWSLATAALILLLWVPHQQGQRRELKYLATSFEHQSFLNALGLVMRPYGATKPVVATDVAGMVPYYSGWEAVDYFGLCDPVLSRHRATGGKIEARFFEGKKVDLLLLTGGALDGARSNYEALRALAGRPSWQYLGLAEGLEVYLNRENRSLESLGPKLRELITLANRSGPAASPWPLQFVPAGLRYRDYLEQLSGGDGREARFRPERRHGGAG